MSGTLQFIQTTPDEVTQPILQGVQSIINQFKADFQPKEPTEYITRAELKERLKVDLSTIHNWCKKGKLKPYGIGNRVYFKWHEVEESLTPLNACLTSDITTIKKGCFNPKKS